MLHGPMARRLAILEEPFDVYIVNHDGMKAPALLEALLKRDDIDVVCIDELAVFRTKGTVRFKAMVNLVKGRKFAWGMTGTPTPNAPTDAWAQCRILTPHTVPPAFVSFQNMAMRQVTQYKWAPKADATATVARVMQPAIRFSREECVDLPPTTHVTRTAPLTPEQSKALDEMIKKMKMEYDGGSVTAVNEAVKLGKLAQICCGVAYGPKGEHVSLPCSPRVELVREIIEEAEAKVIVFVPFTGALLMLADELRKSFSVETVYGGVSKGERDRIFLDFQRSEHPRVLVADARTMSHGLSLTAANTTIWYGPTNSNETYMQANERTPRPGQKLQTLIVHIESHRVETAMYARLKSRGTMQGALLQLLKEM
jgi:SNF2 family DNA or RNA helicase